MTGFKAWVLAGIDLGVGWIMKIAHDIQMEQAEKHRFQIPAVLHLQQQAMIDLVADRIQKKWPLWKVAFTNQKELPLKKDVDFSLCDRCESVYPSKLLHTTPIGGLCAPCLGDYIRELNIDAARGQ